METTTTISPSPPHSGNDVNIEHYSPMLTSSSSHCLSTLSSHPLLNKISTLDYEKISDQFIATFSTWDDREQLIFVENLLKRMHSHQHGQINTLLLPMLQRDFIGQLSGRGLEHIAERILGYLDDQSLVSTELVCRDWFHVVSQGKAHDENSHVRAQVVW